jgi:hypothetical protein
MWNVAEFITHCVNKRGIHPGAHIALDFLLFSFLSTASGLDITVGSSLEASQRRPMFVAGIFEVVAGSVALKPQTTIAHEAYQEGF